jgi:RNA polymerase sigma-B factor
MSGSSTWTEERRAREHELLRQLATATGAEHTAVRDELVTMHLPLVRHLARKYADRGEPFEDLLQVGTLGLITAIDRFDVERGNELSTFAAPYITGEIRRHFRDKAWSVRIPRGLQEMQAPLAAATERLTRELERSPTVAELAVALQVPEDVVLDAMEARHSYSASSLDEALEAGTLSLPSIDNALERIDERETLGPLLEALPPRERQVIVRRFFDEWSQRQIADELGISQMHVSRILARTLSQLRGQLQAD